MIFLADQKFCSLEKKVLKIFFEGTCIQFVVHRYSYCLVQMHHFKVALYFFKKPTLPQFLQLSKY